MPHVNHRQRQGGVIMLLLSLLTTLAVVATPGVASATGGGNGDKCETLSIGNNYQVVRAAPGSVVSLGEAAVPAEYANWTVHSAGASGSNNSSIHEGNNIRITSPGGAGEIMLNNVEGATPGGSSGTITALGGTLKAELIMGPDGVFSGGFSAWVKVCQPNEPEPEPQKVSYCHATPPATAANGWNYLTTSVNAFFNAGHPNHAMDIVAPFTYVKHGETIEYLGSPAWQADPAAGNALLASGANSPNKKCSEPEQPEPEFPVVTITAVGDCLDTAGILSVGDGDENIVVDVFLNGELVQGGVKMAPNSQRQFNADARPLWGTDAVWSFTTSDGQSGSNSFAVPTEETCNPTPLTLTVDGQITCAWDADAMEENFSFAGVINNPHELEILNVSHENGNVVNEAFTFTVDYRDNLGEVQQATAEIVATDSCAPPPVVDPLTLTVSGVITCAWDAANKAEVYTFAGAVNNPNDLEILEVNVQDGPVANEAFTYVVTYKDNLGEVKTATAEITATDSCVPDAQALTVSGQITCAWDAANKVEVFSFAGVVNNPHGLEVLSRNVADGGVANEVFTFEVTYRDNTGAERTATAEIAKANGCKPTPPPPTIPEDPPLPDGDIEETIASAANTATENGNSLLPALMGILLMIGFAGRRRLSAILGFSRLG